MKNQFEKLRDSLVSVYENAKNRAELEIVIINDCIITAPDSKAMSLIYNANKANTIFVIKQDFDSLFADDINEMQLQNPDNWTQDDRQKVTEYFSKILDSHNEWPRPDGSEAVVASANRGLRL